MLDVMARDAALARQEGAAGQRWRGLLQALQKRGVSPGTVFVVLIEKLADDAAPGDVWEEHWRQFTRLIVDSGLPFLVVWSGLAAALQPMRQTLSGIASLTEYRVEALTSAELLPLLPRLRRVLPRAVQQAWEGVVTVNVDTFGNPTQLILATTCAASLAEAQPLSEQMLTSLAAANATELVAHLMARLAQRQAEHTELLRQLTEICAFLPPGEEMTLDDLFLYCDLEGAGLDLVTGRATFEKLAAEFVRYGLLGYDPYTFRYTTANRFIQQALQAYAYPAPGARQAVARRRRHAGAVLRHVQRDHGEALRELAQQIDAEEGNFTPSLLAPYLVPPLCRLLERSTKAERQDMARILSKFPSPLAVEVLTRLLGDEDGQIRSRAAQSLADLEGQDTLPALLRALRDSNGDVRWIAALALGKMPQAETVDALIALLTDEDKEVGRIAAEGLGQKGDSRAVPHLIAAVRDSYPLLRESAALALGQLADARALPVLQELLQDANVQVRRCAEVALARLAPAE
jgi:hypothetical protein